MAWISSPSIAAFLGQATVLWPHRSTASDGTIGDASHANRRSDHNPDDYPGVVDERDADRKREVHAVDLTHDPLHGVDCERLSEQIRQRVLAGDEKRVAYIIFAGRIFNPDVSREWRPYSGSNPHDKHMHVSIRYTNAAENDVSPWFPPPPEPSAPAQESAVLRLILGGSMAVFLSEADEERAFIRHLYLTHLGRPPESFEAVEWWRLELHAKGGDMVMAGISDSDEALAFRAARRCA